jgi:hypothetical protein
VVEQAGIAERIPLVRPLVADDAGHEPRDRLHQDQRRQLTARHDVVADRNLFRRETVDHALVEPLVPAAQDREVGFTRELANERLVQASARGRHREHAAAIGVERLDRREQRLGLHHHAGTAPERRVVHGAMGVGGEGA